MSTVYCYISIMYDVMFFYFKYFTFSIGSKYLLKFCKWFQTAQDNGLGDRNINCKLIQEVSP